MTTHEIQFSHGTVRLNSEQFRVVTSPLTENQRILASAGSGKTTTITARIAYMVEEYDIDPTDILLVTFSRAAAEEMIHRVHRLIGDVPLYAGTFHSLSSQLLRQYAPRMIMDQPFIDELPYRLVKWMEESEQQPHRDHHQPRKRFRCIIVDEFQDINEIQWKLLMKCYHDHATMTIVGDDAQNIYTWRGSSVDFLLRFHETLPHVVDYQLCRNYRSTHAIVQVANAVMKWIPTLPFKEQMVAHAHGTKRPEVHYFHRASDECDWIVHAIEKLLVRYPTYTFAVLSRYNSDLYRIEERMHVRQMRYQFDAAAASAGAGEARVYLATIHGSKGLEWDVVFFMNLQDDVFPSRKSEKEVVCERRLFYVGVTRAKRALYMTYSRQEKALSRFVREIPRPLLRFHNVTSFQRSTFEATVPARSIEDVIRSLDGGDWNTLREHGMIPATRDSAVQITLYPFGQTFADPLWVSLLGVKETWIEWLRLLAFRVCAIHRNHLHELATPAIHECLLTLRIYREDIDFWETYPAEMEYLAHHFLRHIPHTVLPLIDHTRVRAAVQERLPHLLPTWTDQEYSQATVVLSKLRGQLRPLLPIGYDLGEFSFGYVRASVPTDRRTETLQSWRRVLDPMRMSHEIVTDLWRIAALSSVAKGRNIPLYQTYTVQPHLESEEHGEFVQVLSDALPVWLASEEQVSFHVQVDVQHPGLRPIDFDLMTDRCAYQFFFDAQRDTPSTESILILLLKQYIYEEMYDRSMDHVGFVNLASGHVLLYPVTSTIREQLSRLWSYLVQHHLPALTESS